MRLFGKKPQGTQQQISDPGSSIYLGRYLDLTNKTSGTELSYDGERHLLLFGPNGSGKGTRLLVSNLLRLRDRSVVVIDPKGELTAITADYRRSIGDVVVLNPFDVLDLGGSGFNPLASLDPDVPTFVDDAAGIGEALIKIEDKDPHWSESAQSLLVALIMWEVQEAKREGRTPLLENVRRMLTEPNEYERDEDGKNKLVKGLRFTAAKMAAMGGFEIESLVGRFLRDSDEIASIQSTADRQTNWMLSPLMRANMAKNDIDFADLKKRPITVYLILPAERMRTHSVWLRLVIVSALRALYKPGGVRALFMLDEFAQLGHLAPIEDAFGLVRGYGVQLWPVLQDLNQLKALYKDRWETFVGNAGVVQGFAPNDLTTAEWMSRRAGETTVAAAAYNRGDAQSSAGHGSMSQSSGLSYSQARRPLFLPQELMDFREGSGLLWPAGTSKSVPFLAPSYWQVPELQSRAQNNPYYQSATTPPARAQVPAPASGRTNKLVTGAQAIAIKSAPHIKRGAAWAATNTVKVARWAAETAARELPPLMRRLQAFALQCARVIRDQFNKSRQTSPRLEPLAEHEKLGPPVEAGRDASESE
ncbi:MAG: type IV secretory system conjugative DNA transfer family protein [Alphaproteobacteria bacterium]|nr:type IV secretory system conjugative DNA transfer family protein [Alphaproteobacteria bacterium]